MKEDEQELRELLRSWKPYYEFFHPQTGEVISIRIPVNVDQLSDEEVAAAIQSIQTIRAQKIRDRGTTEGKTKFDRTRDDRFASL